MKFSIVVPVHDVAPYVGRCLDSVLAQTFGDFECICVDDGSVDGGGKVLCEYARRDARIKVLSRESSGVSVARNTGIEQAKGDWIGFVDADDVIDERWLSVADDLTGRIPFAEMAYVEGLVRVADDVAYPHGDDEDGCATLASARKQAAGCKLGRVIAFHDDDARAWGESKGTVNGSVCTAFVRRDFLGDVRFVPGVRIKEDVLFMLDVAQRLRHVVLGCFPGYFYTNRRGSAWTGKRRVEDSLAFMAELYRYPRSARKAVSMAAGWDLAYLAHACRNDCADDSAGDSLLEIWRRYVSDGTVDLSAIRWWWRPGIRRWLRTGDFSLLARTRDLRLGLEAMARRFLP